MLGVALLLLAVCSAVVYCEGMITNFVGIQRDFSVVAGVKADVGIRVVDADGGAVNLGLCTWTFGIWKDGNAAKATRYGVQLAKPAGAQSNDMFWQLPVLEAGLWSYELTARGSDGEVARVFYGVIGSREASDIVTNGIKIGVEGWRMMEVQLPAVAGGKLVARWMSGDYVLALCEVARKHAETAERVQGEIEAVLDEAVEEATERAEAAADRAETAANKAEKEAGKAKDSSTLAEELKNDLHNRLVNMIKVIDGYLWIDGEPTHNYVKGTDGLQVYISSDGHWYLSDGTYLGWPATGKDGITPHITADGYWAFGDEVTNYKAVGKDGIDGNSVRRLLVDSYEDIPQEGETCNGGYYYYVKYGKRAKGNSVYIHINDWAATYEEKSADFFLEYIAPNGTGDPLWASNLRGTPADTVAEINNYGYTHLEAFVYDENTVELRNLYDEIGLKVMGGDVYVGTGTDHNIYAWLEDKEGVGSWVHVGIANDVATAEVLGLVKLGTDTPVTRGAPVGTNMKGQMLVGLSTLTDNGTGKISVSDTLDDDSGGIGRNANGQYVARKADNNNFGTVKYSRTDENARLIAVGRVPDGTKVDGDDRGGRLGITRADANTYGGCKVPGAFNSEDHDRAFLANFNYVAPICMRDDTGAKHVNDIVKSKNSDAWYYGANGHLIIALKQGGALQWESHGEANRDGVRFSTKGVLRLKTTGSFAQSENNGLTLNHASANLLGGVFRQETLASGTAVPTGSAVLNYLNGNYYTKGQTYTRTELTKDGGVIETELKEKLPIYAAKELQPYVKKADIEGLYAPASLSGTVSALGSKVDNNKAACDANMAEVLAAVQAMEKKLNGYVRTGDSGIEEISKVAYDDFAKLEALDENMLYLVTEG